MDKLKMGEGTIFEKGYGLIPKLVMIDNSLSIGSKCVYAYLLSYADTEGEAFPSVKKMMYDLNVSKDTFYKYMNELIDCGYVDKHQEKTDNKFAHNVYNIQFITDNVLKNKESRSMAKIKESAEKVVTLPKSSDTRIKDTKSSDTTNYATNNTSSKNINLKNTNEEKYHNTPTTINYIFDYYESNIKQLDNDIVKQRLSNAYNEYGSKAIIEAIDIAKQESKLAMPFVIEIAEGLMKKERVK